MNHDYIQARKSNLNYYQAVPLYYHSKDGSFVLYKPAGVKLSDIRIDQKRHPEKLYTKRPDKLAAIKDYTTVLHSINVMALVIGYASNENYSLTEKKNGLNVEISLYLLLS